MTRTAAESPAFRSTSPEPKMVSAISHPRPIMDAVSNPATVRGSLEAAARLFRTSRMMRCATHPTAAAPHPSSGHPAARKIGSASASSPRSANRSHPTEPGPSKGSSPPAPRGSPGAAAVVARSWVGRSLWIMRALWTRRPRVARQQAFDGLGGRTPAKHTDPMHSADFLTLFGQRARAPRAATAGPLSASAARDLAVGHRHAEAALGLLDEPVLEVVALALRVGDNHDAVGRERLQGILERLQW